MAVDGGVRAVDLRLKRAYTTRTSHGFADNLYVTLLDKSHIDKYGKNVGPVCASYIS